MELDVWDNIDFSPKYIVAAIQKFRTFRWGVCEPHMYPHTPIYCYSTQLRYAVVHKTRNIALIDV